MTHVLIQKNKCSSNLFWLFGGQDILGKGNAKAKLRKNGNAASSRLFGQFGDLRGFWRQLF